jgi:hypothetical protein
MRGVCLLAMSAGCAYRAGSFGAWGHDFPGRRTTIGCLDLAIERRADNPTGPVLAYDFGNRCDGPLLIDLHTTSVVARTAHGDLVMLPYDPERKIRALPLDGRSVGSEAIEYRTDLAGTELTAICVDAASVVGIMTPDWQCFAQPSQITEAAR